MEKAMLITGNPIDGFAYIGPFQTHEEAVEYADTHNDEFDGDWWVATLNAPTEDEESEGSCYEPNETRPSDYYDWMR